MSKKKKKGSQGIPQKRKQKHNQNLTQNLPQFVSISINIDELEKTGHYQKILRVNDMTG